MPTAPRVSILVCLSCCLLGSGLAATAIQTPAVPLAERVRGAELVVVGRVASVAPGWQVNEFGERLIVSVVRVVVNETLVALVMGLVGVVRKIDSTLGATGVSRSSSASKRGTSQLR